MIFWEGKGDEESMIIHVVQAEESLWKISQAYGISLQQLIDANKISDPERLVVGQALVVTTRGEFHTVRPGESLWLISRHYGVSVAEIVRTNNIWNPNNIQVGLRLYIPRSKRTIESNAYVDPRMTGTRTAELEEPH